MVCPSRQELIVKWPQLDPLRYRRGRGNRAGGEGVMFVILISFYKTNSKPPDIQPTLVAMVMEYAFDSVPGFILSMCIVSPKIFVHMYEIKSTLIISTSVISNSRLARREKSDPCLNVEIEHIR